MRRFIAPLLAVSLVASALAAPSLSFAAKKKPPPPPKASPVVIESFTSSNVKVGKKDTVIVRIILGTKPIRGASLGAQLRLVPHTGVIGKGSIATYKGPKTNKNGQASLKFTIPKAAAGKWLNVHVILKVGKLGYTGNNWLHIPK